MIELKAISPVDGWAYAVADGTTWLIRPPYKASRRLRVSEDDVERAVIAYGFSAADDVLGSWGELIDLLNTKVAEVRADTDADASEDVEQDLLELAPVDVLNGFLGRIEQELIPNAEFEHAEDLLLGLLRTRTVGQTNELRERAVGLLGIVRERRDVRLRLATWPEKNLKEAFPHAFRVHRIEEVMDYANEVSDRHHLFQLPN